MGDRNFRRSVFLMIEHSRSGAIGLVLNQATKTTTQELFPEWGSRTNSIPEVFVGGPVEPNSCLALGRFIGETSEPHHFIFSNVGIIDLGSDPDMLPESLTEMKIFSGYSGWSPMQLDSELAADAWFVVEADPFDVFSSNHHELWSLVLRRQKGPMAWLANYPEDPKLN